MRYLVADGVLFDRMAITVEDFGVEGEERFVTVGQDSLGQVLVVCYTYRGEIIRTVREQ